MSVHHIYYWFLPSGSFGIFCTTCKKFACGVIRYSDSICQCFFAPDLVNLVICCWCLLSLCVAC